MKYYEDKINEYAEQIEDKFTKGRLTYARYDALMYKLEEWEDHAVALTQEAIELYGEES